MTFRKHMPGSPVPRNPKVGRAGLFGMQLAMVVEESGQSICQLVLRSIGNWLAPV